MVMIGIAVAVGTVLAYVLITAWHRRRKGQVNIQSVRRLLLGIGGFNLATGLAMLVLSLLWFLAPQVALAAGLAQSTSSDTYAAIAAAIAVGIGSIGAAYAVGATGSAAIGVIAEKPETFGRVLIFVGLAEGIAIYGLIVAFMILGR